MKSILYNIQDVASDISSFTNCDEIDYLVLNQSLHPLKILFKIIVMIIPKYRKKIQIWIHRKTRQVDPKSFEK